MKLPEKICEPKHDDRLINYARGWNATIDYAEYMCSVYRAQLVKEELLKNKEYTLKREKTPFYKGEYDCIIEIEKLNELGD